MSDESRTQPRFSGVEERGARVQWGPAITATFVSLPLLGLSLLGWVMALVVSPQAQAHQAPEVTVIQPSGLDIAVGVARHVLPILLGAGLLVLTWRFAARGDARKTWACAVAAVVIGIVALF